MSVVQLFDEDGHSHELARLREDNERLRGMLMHAHDEIDTERENVRKWKKENSSLKAQITRHERLSQNVNHPLVVAVFDFWLALKAGRKFSRGPARAQAILAGLSWVPPKEPRDYVYPVLGIALAPVEKPGGKGAYEDISIALRDDIQFDKWSQIGREAGAWEANTWHVVEKAGGEKALKALDRILELQQEWEKKKVRGVNDGQPGGKEADDGGTDE